MYQRNEKQNQSKDYRSKIKNNPIKLVKAIKEHLLSYQENHYNIALIFNSLKTL
jgi:phage anti-repressor protein